VQWRKAQCWAYAAERPGISIVQVLSFHTYVVLKAGNTGCAAHIKRTASRRTPCWKRTDLKEGTTDDTMARRFIFCNEELYNPGLPPFCFAQHLSPPEGGL